ncbi:MAG: DUF3048 domain-containing protein [Butyrivibrio sp.]|uniref:DUF3048 domain-containing protein n=1 Tax=Butyrivibrio sp. TaxID=28121 RepID=UPI0025DD2818|nr:DUF3048 domain-containing protein [Butyrivibrio sp.]MCR5769815.1 DUF3048 domain-containing protein [Butyrivibrio sp.]
MKKRFASLFVTGLCAAMIAGCGSDDSTQTSGIGSSATAVETPTVSATTETSTEEVAEEVATTEVPEGMYLSELTGEPIDESLKDQRPIAVMVDNELTALPHYGTAEADIVYELMNSTKNNRITRLMCIFKDWESIEQLGSIRSTRPTNIVLAAEFNAVLCHDGGPYYNDSYFAQDLFADHFSGIFSRVNNGKSREFTEYIVSGDLDSAFSNSSISTTYNENRFDDGEKFYFTDYGTTVDLSAEGTEVSDVTEVVLPFYHNSSTLKYNEETQMYEYYEYGEIHLDAEDDEPLAFDNVILQNTSHSQLDENGYLVYNYLDSGEECTGYYLTKGQCIPIYWIKGSQDALTYYFTDSSYSQELQINTGKTYVALVPRDTWDEVELNN